MIGCNEANDFSNKDLKNISVIQHKRTLDSSRTYTNYIDTKVCSIINHDSLNFILNILNSKDFDPAVFIPDYILELNYSDTLIHLSIKDNYIKNHGKTFKVSKNLSEYFSSLHVNAILK